MTMGTRLRRAAGIRDAEGTTLGLIAAVFASLEAGRGLGEVGVNSLVLARLPPDALPWLFIPLGLISMVVAVGFGAALGRVRRGSLFGWTLAAIAVLLTVEWMALAGVPGVVPIAWLTVMAAGAIAITIGWTVAASSLDARQAKRLFPLCTAAAIAGYFVGSLAAGPVARLAGTEVLLVAQAVLFVVAALVIRRLARHSTATGWATPDRASRRVTDDVRVGFDEVRRSPLMRLIAVAYVLFAVLMFSVSYPFHLAARSEFPVEADLTATLGIVAAGVTATSFVVSLVVANRFYARFGIAAAALLLPLVYLAGFALWIVRFTFVTAAAVSIAQQVTQRGLSNAAWSAFYNVVPAPRRAQALAFNDGVPGQLGIMLSGVLLLTAGRVLAPDQVFWLGLATAALCAGVVIVIRRRYGAALIATLRSGEGERVLEGGPGIEDLLAAPDVRSTLIRALDDREPAARAMAAALLARSHAPDARAALASTLDDPDPTVRSAAVVAILRDADGDDEREGARDRAETVLAGLLDGATEARIAGLRALLALHRPLGPARREAARADPEAGVRAAAIELLAGTDDERETATLVVSLGDPSPRVRHAAAAALARRPTPAAGVVELLAHGSADEQEAAIAALAGHGPAVHGTVLQWADAQVGRALWLSEAAEAIRHDGHAGPVADTDFLASVLERRIERHQDLALGAMRVLGAPEATGVIRRCLRSTDPDLRAQAIEALDSLGDRRLGSAIARLVDPPPLEGRHDRHDLLRRLSDDEDVWIAGLAQRIRVDGGTVTETTRSLGDIDRMLRLRRVPLFERLAPEDLQRIATVATERSFGGGEALVRQGESGDELFVILEGTVRVSRHDPGGEERHLRTYGEGDHIGELAVLRERPRAATVTATEPGVRALVIKGAGLTAILRERPDAAMAMLATLAERISIQ
jgi:HEAT repeat protein